MAFSSSLPIYNLDHHQYHHNNIWQHQLQQQQSGNNLNHHQLLHQNPQLLPPPLPEVEPGLIRPGSTVDRARLAKVPLPEAGLNCPRCDSTQTKFCYFNNYSLTQPRHFCKTCRRYWTRGGALRSVPVGGGCRRNKRTKSSTRTTKSINITTNSTNPKEANISTESPSSSADKIVANHVNPFSSQVPLNMDALQNLNSQYGAAAGSTAYGTGFKMGNGSNSDQSDMRFQLGHHTPSSVNNSIILSGGGAHGWRLPILPGFEQQTAGSNPFSYQGQGREVASAGPVKVEETQRGFNLSRQVLDVSNHQNNNENNQYVLGYW